MLSPEETQNGLPSQIPNGACKAWTLQIVESLDIIPEIYFKHLENTDGLYEIRVQVGNDIFRIFCFFDNNNLVVIGHGFQKKTQKTPAKELERAVKIKKEYYEQKKSYKP